jgi:hypothetical protein
MTGKITKVANPDLVLKGNCLNEANMSVGGVSKGNYPETKTSGIVVRGGKAQTKGKMARGPMA